MVKLSSLLTPYSCHLLMQEVFPPFSFESDGFCSRKSCFGCCFALWALVCWHQTQRALWNTHRCRASSASAPGPGVTSHPGWLRAPSRARGAEIKGEGDVHCCPPAPPELRHRSRRSLPGKALGWLPVWAALWHGVGGTRSKDRGAHGGGGYLVSPAQLGVCSSLSSQNIVIVSVRTGEFLKQESKSSGWTPW